MKIADREIGNGLLPYLIAEISCNHGGDFNTALQLIKAAKWAGADAVKFQAYTPDTMTLNCVKPDFIIQEGLWKGQNLYELYRKTHTPFDWFPKLFKAAQKESITLFASVFDASSVDMLERLGCPAYKIASMEITDIPLIRYAAKTGKPLIISTGMAKNKEIIEAKEAAGEQVAFLHCTSEYPGTIEFADLGKIEVLRRLVPKCPVGLSDHTPFPIVPMVATGLGVAIIEKHLMLDGSKTEDKEFSMNDDDFQLTVMAVKQCHQAMQPREFLQNPSRQFRRSLYAVSDIKEGEKFNEANIRSIRPGYGIPPKHLPSLMGRAATQNYRRGDRIN